MKKLIPFLILGAVLCPSIMAQECSSQMDVAFDTNPSHSKYFLGDTSAGYAVLSYTTDPNIFWVIKGQFPRARFLSIESQDTKLSINEDAIFDFKIEPDAGSINPFVEGNPIDVTSRSFTVTASQDVVPGSKNAIRLPSKGNSQSLMFRYYSPNVGVTLTKADLPKLYAYDKRTMKERSCPKHANYPYKFHFPQFLADVYTSVNPDFTFKLPPSDMKAAGLNKAASYLYAVSKLSSDEVAVFRFKAPTFTNTRSGSGNFHSPEQVRYWSFCAVNFPNNLTNACVPDYLAVAQGDGFQYIAVGKGNDVKEEAERRGYSFIADNRKPNQNVYGFVYRNILPKKDFKESSMYQGAFIPEPIKCKKSEFLANRCGW